MSHLREMKEIRGPTGRHICKDDGWSRWMKGCFLQAHRERRRRGGGAEGEGPKAVRRHEKEVEGDVF